MNPVKALFVLAALTLALPAYAADLAYDYKTGRVVRVFEVKNDKVLVEAVEDNDLRKVWRDRKDAPLEVQEYGGLKKGDKVMFYLRQEVEGQKPQVYAIHSQLFFLFEDGIARVAKTIRGEINHSYVFYPIGLKNVVRPVESLGGFNVGEQACLKKRVGSYPEGDCNKIVRMYQNGYVELLSFSLFGLREKWGEHDLLLHVSELKKPEVIPEESVNASRAEKMHEAPKSAEEESTFSSQGDAR